MIAAMQETLELPFWPDGGALDGMVVVLDAAGGGCKPLDIDATNFPTQTPLTPADRAVHIAAQVRHHFTRDGATVPMVRWDDRYVSPGSTPEADGLARASWARDARAHLMVSVEDAPPGKTRILVAEGDDLSFAIAREIGAAFMGEVSIRAASSPLLDAMDGVPAVVVRLPRDDDRDLDFMASSNGSHRDLARSLHAGLCRVWESLQDQLEERRQAQFPNAPQVRVVPPVPAEVIARTLWPHPEPPKTANEANYLLTLLKRAQISDRTIQRFDVRARQHGDGWVVEGAVSHPRLKQAAEGLLKATGCKEVENRIETLPSAKLGKLCYGLVRIPMAMTWVHPREGDDVQTQLRLGECLFLLDQTPDKEWYLIQGEDAYIGWVREDAVLPMDAEAFDEWRSRKRALVMRDAMFGGFRIPSGAKLPIVEERPSTHSLVLELPPGEPSIATGATIQLPTPHASAEDLGSRGNLAAEIALEFLGTPYSFGGRTALGIDCSGLAGTAWSAAGLTLPRDAFEQALMGSLVATCWHRTHMHAGDLLFFIDEGGRTFHVAVSLGGQRFVHSSPPEVHVCSLDPADPLFRQRWLDAYLFTRRPIG